MINNTINNCFNVFLLFKLWVAILFLLFLVTKPFVQNALVQVDVKYELIETSEKESSLDDEILSAFEDEVKYCDSNNDILQLYIKKEFSNFCNYKTYLNYKLDILLPPPRI